MFMLCLFYYYLGIFIYYLVLFIRYIYYLDKKILLIRFIYLFIYLFI